MRAEQEGYEPAGHEQERAITAMTVPIASLVVVRIGLAIWVIALILVWTVPVLSAGDRSWWRWVPVAALVVGLLGHTYVTRGRGSAEQA